MTWRLYLHLNTEVSVSLMVFGNNDVLLFLAAIFEASLSKKQLRKLLIPAGSKMSQLQSIGSPLYNPPTQLWLFAINFFIARIMPCLLAKVTQWIFFFSLNFYCTLSNARSKWLLNCHVWSYINAVHFVVDKFNGQTTYLGNLISWAVFVSALHFFTDFNVFKVLFFLFSVVKILCTDELS